MQTMSHSLHVSSKGHSIKTTNDLRSVDSHNNRKFEKSNNENLDSTLSNLNTTLIGSDNISNDVTNLYTELFDSSVKEFNARQKNKDRICNDYMQKVANSQQQFIAEEIIVQLGSSNKDDVYLNFLKNNDLTTEQKEKVHETMKDLYSDYLNELQKQIPNFKVANATLHMDETNPHLHIVGVPISENNKRGMKTKVSKGRVFTQTGLSEIQDYMGKRMEELVLKHFGLEVEHKKSEGINKNLTPKEIKARANELKKHQDKISELTHKNERLEKENFVFTGKRDIAQLQYDKLLKEREAFNENFESFIDNSILGSDVIPLLDLLDKKEGDSVPSTFLNLSEQAQAVAYKIAVKQQLVASKEIRQTLAKSHAKASNMREKAVENKKRIRGRKKVTDNGLEL